MLSDKITSFFFFLKEDKVAFNEKKKKKKTKKNKKKTKKTNAYLKIFIHHYKNMFYIFKKNISINTFKEMI